MKDSFVVYRSFYLALSSLKNKDRLKLYDAIFEFGLNHKEIDLDHVPKAMFHLIKPQLEANHRKYLNGKLGGRGNKAKEKQKESKPKANKKQSESKIVPNGNANVNEKDNVYMPLKNGNDWRCSDEFYKEMLDIYGKYDNIIVDDELLKMRAWLISNPARQKTHVGMPRFVSSWLSRKSEKAEKPTDSYANIHAEVMKRKNVLKQ